MVSLLNPPTFQSLCLSSGAASDTKHPCGFLSRPRQRLAHQEEPKHSNQSLEVCDPPVLPSSPPRRGVGPALHGRRFLLLVAQGHCGGRVSLGYCHLLGLGGLLPAVWAVAGVVHLRGTALVEAVGDAALGLTLHESALKKPQRRNSAPARAVPHPFTRSMPLLSPPLSALLRPVQ